MDLVDLRQRLASREVRQLIEQAFGSRASAQTAIRRFQVGDWTALGFEDADEVVAFVGVEVVSPAAARIRGIAVVPNRRQRGIGRRLIHALEVRDGVTLLAETDNAAVGFYERCGFRVSSLGEQYPGVERFECVRPAS